MYSTLFRKAIFPAVEFFYGTQIQGHLAFLTKSQWWSKEEMEDHQNRRLRALIKDAYASVPYYHHLLEWHGIHPDDIKCIRDLRKLPILTKDQMKAKYPDFISSQPSPTMAWSSGGSTGEPLQFIRSKEDYSWAWAAAYRAWGWAGYKIGNKYATIWGSSVALPRRRHLIKRMKNYFTRNLLLSAYDMGKENVRDYIRALREFQPEVIRGYSQAIFFLAQFMEDNNISGIQPRAVLTTAETLFDHQRALIEKEFGCRVYDGYGGGEAPSAAYECQEHRGYHVTAENLILECVREGEPAAPGEMGRILITNLHSSCMPFIRYDMGDLGSMSDEECSCGRHLPLLGSIDGRVNDFIFSKDGNIIHNYFFSALFRGMAGIDQFQVVQESPDHLVLKFVKNARFRDSDLLVPLQEIKMRFGEDSRVDVEFLDEIPVSPRSGKRRFVISKVPLKF